MRASGERSVGVSDGLHSFSGRLTVDGDESGIHGRVFLWVKGGNGQITFASLVHVERI